jgi:sterol desaturase/sphingolipid hydroxylase (fatty acid hydroxylase superfamily)
MAAVLDFVRAVIDQVTWFDLTLFGLAWLGVFVGAVIGYRQNVAPPRSLTGFVRYCFPQFLFQRTTFMDVCCSLLIYPIFNWPLQGAKWAITFLTVHGQHTVLSQTIATPEAHSAGPLPTAIATLLAVVCVDLGIFTAHFLMHKSRVLWEFHKMHHSSTSLIPATTNRAHPIEDGLEVFFGHIYGGLTFGTFWYVFHLDPVRMTIYGVDWFIAFQLLNLFHLRHSHIYLRMPAWWEFVFCSPRNHQVHHSLEPQHWDRNFGHTLALWDRLLGSYVDPPPTRDFAVGLSHAEPGHYDRVWKLYLLPFARVWQIRRVEGWLSLFSTRRFSWQMNAGDRPESRRQQQRRARSYGL